MKTIQIKTFKNPTDAAVNKFMSNHPNSRIVSYNPIIVEYSENQLESPYLTLTGKRVKFRFDLITLNKDNIWDSDGFQTYVCSKISFFNNYIHIDYEDGRLIKDMGMVSDVHNDIKIVGIYSNTHKLMFYGYQLSLDVDELYTEYQGHEARAYEYNGQYQDWIQKKLEKVLVPIQSHIAYNKRTNAFIQLGQNIEQGLNNVSGSIVEAGAIVGLSNIMSAEIEADASDRMRKTIRRYS